MQGNERKRCCLVQQKSLLTCQLVNLSTNKTNVERHELAGKVGKDTGSKTHSGNNLAKLNDANSIAQGACLSQNAIAKRGKCMCFAGLSALKNARIAHIEVLFCQLFRMKL